MLRRASDLRRDWRIRTLIPVIAIHLAVFTALYLLVYHLAVDGILATHRFGATALLDQVELNFRELMAAHAGPQLRQMLQEKGRNRHLVKLEVYNASASPLTSTTKFPSSEDVREVRQALANPRAHTEWFVHRTNGYQLYGVRVLGNDAACQGCHRGEPSPLGAIELGVDIGPSVAAAKARVRLNLAIIAAAWVLLLAVMLRVKVLVVGRPLTRIERALQATGAPESSPQAQDPDAIATRLDRVLWGMVERQRAREQDINRQMTRAERLAALGEVAAGLTHEIKNPVAGVIGALEVLRSASPAGGPPPPELYNEMLAELRRAVATVDSLLRLARPQPPRRTAVEMTRVAQDVALLFEPRLRRQMVTFKVEVEGAIPVLHLDPDLMKQLLINLLNNSLQATGRGGTVTVLLAPFPHHDGVVLVVSDSGKGIAPENLDRVFDPFFTTKEEGTGLGLAICREIVQQHGGTITAESQPGKGTRIVVLLPAAAGAGSGRDGAAATD